MLFEDPAFSLYEAPNSKKDTPGSLLPLREKKKVCNSSNKVST